MTLKTRIDNILRKIIRNIIKMKLQFHTLIQSTMGMYDHRRVHEEP